MRDQHDECQRPDRLAAIVCFAIHGSSTDSAPITAPTAMPLMPKAVPMSAKPIFPTNTPTMIAPIDAAAKQSCMTNGSLLNARQHQRSALRNGRLLFAEVVMRPRYRGVYQA